MNPNPVISSVLSAIGTYLLLDYLQQRHDITTILAGTIAPIVSPRAKIPGTGIIHSAMVDPSGGEQANSSMITSFNSLAGKRLGAVYFTNIWGKGGIEFPTAIVQQIKAAGAVPIIRMNSIDPPNAGSVHTCAQINSGSFDTQLKQYAANAKAVGTPLGIEFGTELGGKFLPFAKEGPAPYKQAFRKIVGIFRAIGANNCRFFFHGDYNGPGADTYYPGDDVVDWIGSSFYGDSNKKGCIGSIALKYAEWSATSKTKPLAVLEWSRGQASDTSATLAGLPKYPRIKLTSIWAEKGHTDRRINSNPANLSAYKTGIASPVYVSKFYDP